MRPRVQLRTLNICDTFFISECAPHHHHCWAMWLSVSVEGSGVLYSSPSACPKQPVSYDNDSLFSWATAAFPAKRTAPALTFFANGQL